jgi:hypothetical protein
VEGRNIGIEYRWAGGEYDRVPVLVRRAATVIVASDSTVSAWRQHRV